nr:hypothetical protein [Tanacetum cinerariifolium]
MADQRTMAELLRAPTEGYAEAIVVPSILAEHFELKRSLINMMTSNQFFGLEKDNPHDHIPRRWLEKEPPRSILTWEDLVSKFINEFFPPQERQISEMKFLTFNNDLMNLFMRHGIDTKISFMHALIGFTELHQLDTFYNALNPADQDSLNSAVGGNLLERHTQDVLMIIENKSNVRNSRNKSIISQVKSSDGNSSSSEIANLTRAVNHKTSDVTTAMTAILKQFQATPPPASVKAVEEICVTSGGAHPYYQCELKAITTRSGLVLDGPFVPMPPPFINPKEDERVEETLTDPELDEFTFKVPPPLVQKAKPPSQRNYVVHQRDPLHPNIPYPSRMHNQKQQDKDEIQIHKFWQMFKQLHINITLTDALILISNEIKCKALADLGASINLMPLFVWKKLGLPELISTRMTLEFANRAICTPAGIARDVFIPIGKFTFPADFVIIDYQSDPKVPLILGRPFLRTARALIDIHEEEMILQSINMINIYNDSYEDYLEDLFATNHVSGNPTFSSHSDLTSPKVKDDIFDPEGDIVLIDKLLNLDYTKDLPPPHNIDPLSGSTTSSSFSNHLLEEFADELALITFSSGNNDLLFDIESNLKEIEYLLNHDPIKEMDSILEDSIDENDDLDEYEYDNDDSYNDPFDSKGEKIKESKFLIDELDLPRSSDFFSFPEYDSFLFEDFFEVGALPSTNNEEKVPNPGILIHENLFEDIVQVAPDKNVKKISISHASLILEDFDPPIYELSFHKEVPGSETLLSFSFENEKKFSSPGFSLLKEFILLFSRNYLIGALKLSKSLKTLKARWRFFLALTERTFVSWMLRVSISIPHEQINSGVGSS